SLFPGAGRAGGGGVAGRGSTAMVRAAGGGAPQPAGRVELVLTEWQGGGRFAAGGGAPRVLVCTGLLDGRARIPHRAVGACRVADERGRASQGPSGCGPPG